MEAQRFSYDNKIVRNFVYATILWGIVGMLVGLLAALQLTWPVFNLGTEYTSFGRIRPLHTNAIIFAFIGNAIFAGVYYSLPRLCKASMWNKTLSKINFWGWQLIIVLAAVSLLLGITTSNEYAELEWPIDILIAIVWVIFGVNMFGTILTRRVKHIYVSIWFYIATFVAIAMLHIVRSIEIPYSWISSYPAYSGVQDALVQWWYGHNAVGFFLTTAFLGIMYYFLPKAANRPIYSYRLSIIHFWSLIFIYIWSGPHHLLYTALPGWAQSLGVVFSIMLIAPSWGGMFNGLLTLRGAWDKVREEPVLKFFVVGITAYGLGTFEGPMLSLKWVSAMVHYTDWIVGHVHVSGMGWNGCIAFAVIYWLVPKIFSTSLYSKKMANVHFWLATLGIIIYAIPLYVAGLMQALLLKEFNTDGFLANPNFMETLLDIMPMYHTRILGGLLYFAGAIIMVVNVIKTVKAGKLEAEEMVEAMSYVEEEQEKKDEPFHRWLERKPVQMLALSLVVVLIGSIFELVPMYMINNNQKSIIAVTPYTPLELQGMDIYIKEGCNNCHTQMVRPLRSETERYGEYSKADEFIYAAPHLWGSRRTGPDLARSGVKGATTYKNAAWHYLHMQDPQKTIQGSIMPAYPWLLDKKIDIASTPAKIRTLQRLGRPYPDGYDQIANEDLKKQAEGIAQELRASGIEAESDTEIIALIAYLHKLGSDISK